ncbi:MAG: MerR family transcriptional regulator, partial [Desulfitobacterium hafniense]
YHQIGLLIPSQMTASGHRLYNENDVKRLYQIITLKNFGFRLEEIGKMTSSIDPDPLVLINLQVEKAAEALELQQALYN